MPEFQSPYFAILVRGSYGLSFQKERLMHRKLRIEQLERMDMLSLSFPVDLSIVEVQGGTLTVSSIQCSTLIIGGGAGSPGSGGPGTMSGGTLRYSSDAFGGESITGVNGAALTCTDPVDLTNAWRSTITTPGGPAVQTPDGTREFGPVTTYQNRFGQIIATEQVVSDTIDGVTTQHTSYTANVRGESSTIYAEDAIADIVPATDLTIETTDQGTIVQQSNDGLLNQTVTRDGAEQLRVTDDGATRTVTIGPEVFTQPDNYEGPHPNAPAGPIPEFEVAHGTGFWEGVGAAVGGSCPSGDYAQPPSSGSGFYSITENAPLKQCNATVMLFGTTGYSCNTLQSSTISNNAGTIKGEVQSWTPVASYVVNYVIEGTMYVTTADPSQPSLGGTPNGSVNVTITDAGGFSTSMGISCSSANPIPGAAGILKVPIAPISGSVTISCGAGSKAWVATISPSMANRGPGLVVFVGMMQITSITKVTPPPPPPGAAPEIVITEAPVVQAPDAPVVKKTRAVTYAAITTPHVIDDLWMVNHKPAAHDHYFSELGMKPLLEVAL